MDKEAFRDLMLYGQSFEILRANGERQHLPVESWPSCQELELQAAYAKQYEILNNLGADKVDKMILAGKRSLPLVVAEGVKFDVPVFGQQVAFFIHQTPDGEKYLSHWASGRNVGQYHGVTFQKAWDSVTRLNKLLNRQKTDIEVGRAVIDRMKYHYGEARLLNLLNSVEVLNA